MGIMSLLFGNPAGRGLVGAATGAALGYGLSPYDESTNRLGSAIRGGIMGAVAGLSPTIAKGLFSRPGLTALGVAGRTSLSISKAALLGVARHPYMVGGIAGGVAILNSNLISGRSLSLSGQDSMINYSNEANAINRLGSLSTHMVPASSFRNQRLERSADGLVFGLHKGRHSS